MSISENLIKKINKEKIKPRSPYVFILKNLFLWCLGIISIILGAISFSLLLYLFKDQTDLLLNNFGANLWELALALIPLIWLFFLISFSFLFYFNLKKTKRAYKYSSFSIFLFGLIASFLLGLTFNQLGFSRQVDNYLAKKVSPCVYRRYLNPQIQFWSQPKQGRLFGYIIDIEEDSLIIKDINNQSWQLVYDKNLINRHNLRFEPGMVLRVFGHLDGQNIFHLLEVLPCRHHFKAKQGLRK